MDSENWLCRLRSPLTVHDIVLEDFDVLISIWSSVLMPKTNGVSQFVDDNAKLVAMFSKANCLSAPTLLSNKGAAPRSFNVNINNVRRNLCVMVGGCCQNYD